MIGLAEGAALFAAAAIAGAINAVAGGGTLVTFPTLLAVGTDPIVANATSTLALWPGSLGGIWGYRQELGRAERWLLWLGVPSLLGGAAGAGLLLWTPPATFEFLVPYLILFATLLFMLQEPIARARASQPAGTPSAWHIAAAILFQSLVAVYGGYFGAGIGILMLAALGLLGIGDIHQMNGLKSLFAMCINGVAAVCFAGSGRLGPENWLQVVVMVIGSIAGGYGGARFARRLGQRTVRRLVICIGLVIATVMLTKQLRSG